ncbi:MAG TPA: Mov34/MPN/PAD-1 family protein [Candidatus Lokiarchaeia archaeon]|nr:Mov34/MPN/PAD-1 family protein [Candidatus Lokiarchaeia archaeon]
MEGAFIESWIDEFIKERGMAAKETTNKEIYGWLIGYESKDGSVMVISAIACQRYNEQTVIGAQPDPAELQELGFALPVGVGFVGIYHSHPDEVFHSSTDNKTLMTYSRFYPKMLSAVTNGTETKWYRYDGKSKFTEFEIEQAFVVGEQLQFVRAEAQFAYNVATNPQKPAIPQISSAARAGFLAAWPSGKAEFLVLDAKKDKNAAAACDLSPEDCVVAMGKATGLKLVESVPIQKIKDKHFQYFKDGKTLVRFDMKMQQPRIEKGMIQVSGIIALDTVLAIVTDSTSNSFEMLRDRLVDDLLVKVGRGFFTFTNGQPSFTMAKTVDIPYLGIPLKIAMSQPAASKGLPDKNFKPDYFPTKSKFIDAEKRTFDGMRKRAVELGLSGKVSIANKMLENLRSIAREHHQDVLVESCSDDMELLKKWNEQ